MTFWRQLTLWFGQFSSSPTFRYNDFELFSGAILGNHMSPNTAALFNQRRYEGDHCIAFPFHLGESSKENPHHVVGRMMALDEEVVIA